MCRSNYTTIVTSCSPLPGRLVEQCAEGEKVAEQESGATAVSVQRKQQALVYTGYLSPCSPSHSLSLQRPDLTLKIIPSFTVSLHATVLSNTREIEPHFIPKDKGLL